MNRASQVFRSLLLTYNTQFPVNTTVRHLKLQESWTSGNADVGNCGAELGAGLGAC